MITRSMARKRTVEEGKGLESESLTPKEKGPRKQESLKKNKELRIQLSGSICMFLDQKISKHGEIYEGEQRHGDFASLAIAIKLVEKNKQNLTEARILAKLNHHSHVISSIDSGFYHNGLENHIYIALDRCHNENLREYVTNRKKQGIPFDLNRTTEIENQIITGVEYIHSKQIIHKDLKPDNILFSLDQKLIKIADFGLSEEIDSVPAEVFVNGQFGTAGYRPPESFGKSIISLKSDIYSLGIIFYYISSNGEHPFGDDSDAWNYNMKNGIMDLSKLLVPNPKTTQHLIECMIQIKLNDRPTIWQVSRHPCWSGNEVECDFDYCCDEASNAPTYDEEETLCPNIDDLWKLVEMLKQHTLKTNSAQDGQMLMNISGQEEAAGGDVEMLSSNSSDTSSVNNDIPSLGAEKWNSFILGQLKNDKTRCAITIEYNGRRVQLTEVTLDDAACMIIYGDSDHVERVNTFNLGPLFPLLPKSVMSLKRPESEDPGLSKILQHMKPGIFFWFDEPSMSFYMLRECRARVFCFNMHDEKIVGEVPSKPLQIARKRLYRMFSYNHYLNELMKNEVVHGHVSDTVEMIVGIEPKPEDAGRTVKGVKISVQFVGACHLSNS